MLAGDVDIPLLWFVVGASAIGCTIVILLGVVLCLACRVCRASNRRPELGSKYLLNSRGGFMSDGIDGSRHSAYDSILGTGYDSHGLVRQETSSGQLQKMASAESKLGGAGSGDHSGLLIDPALVSVTHKLAAGAYGAVYLGVFAGVNVVVKELYSQMLEGDNEELLHEARMLHSLRHPRIVTFYGVTWRGSGPAPAGWKGGGGTAPHVTAASVDMDTRDDEEEYSSASFDGGRGGTSSMNDESWLAESVNGEQLLSRSAPSTWNSGFLAPRGGSGGSMGDLRVGGSDVFSLNSQPSSGGVTPVNISRPRAMSPDSQAWAGLMQAAEDEHAKLLLVTEYCGQGSLGEAIRKGKYDTHANFLRHAVQLAGTLDWLHRKSPAIIHRDIKPGNMLLDDRGDLKLCDLGLARAQPLESNDTNGNGALATMTGGLGSAPFVPPEIMKGGSGDLKSYLAGTPIMIRYDGRAWDVYSMAMCLVYMWQQQPLYPGRTRYQIITGVAGGLRPDLRTGPPISSGKRGFRTFPPRLAELIRQMWQQDPAARPTAGEVLRSLESMKGELSEWGRTGRRKGRGSGSKKSSRGVKSGGGRRATAPERWGGSGRPASTSTPSLISPRGVALGRREVDKDMLAKQPRR